MNPNQRKRTAKELEKSANPNNENEKKISVKERSKVYRARKKKYYQELEVKVKALEEENKKLRVKLNELQSNFSEEATKSTAKLIQEENFVENELPKLIKNNPAQFRMSMYEQSRQVMGPFGTERIKVLKQAFRTIIEYCLPTTFKSILSIFNQSSGRHFLRLYRERIRNNRKSYKFYQLSKDDQQQVEKESEDIEGDNSQQNTSQGSKNPSHKDSDKLRRVEGHFQQHSFTGTAVKQWGKSGPVLYELLNKLKGHMQGLVETRNKIFTCLNEIHELFYSCDIYKGFSATDVLTFSEVSKEIKGSDLIDPYSLWEVKKRDPEKDEYEDDQLSWIE